MCVPSLAPTTGDAASAVSWSDGVGRGRMACTIANTTASSRTSGVQILTRRTIVPESPTTNKLHGEDQHEFRSEGNNAESKTAKCQACNGDHSDGCGGDGSPLIVDQLPDEDQSMSPAEPVQTF